MEYTTMPKLMGKLKDTWEDVKEGEASPAGGVNPGLPGT